MEELETRISSFHLAYQKAWFMENKPQGFEIMDIRLGGLKQRVISCRERLTQYVNNEITAIPELCEAVLDKTNGIFWSRLVSAGRISMEL